jgi:hypothetical protein
MSRLYKKILTMNAVYDTGLAESKIKNDLVARV